MTKILIVDDHPFFLHGFSRYLDDSSEYEIETAASVREATAMIDAGPPDLAMLDVTMHDGGGLKVLRHIRDNYPDTKAMFLTVHIDPGQVAEAMRLGVSGIALKDEEPDAIVAVMQRVLSGENYFAQDVMRWVNAAGTGDLQSPGVRADDLLTGREQEMVDLVCQGMRNKDIGDHCGISEGTVKIHLNKIFRKLGVSSRAELIVKRGGIRASG